MRLGQYVYDAAKRGKDCTRDEIRVGALLNSRASFNICACLTLCQTLMIATSAQTNRCFWKFEERSHMVNCCPLYICISWDYAELVSHMRHIHPRFQVHVYNGPSISFKYALNICTSALAEAMMTQACICAHAHFPDSKRMFPSHTHAQND